MPGAEQQVTRSAVLPKKSICALLAGSFLRSYLVADLISIGGDSEHLSRLNPSSFEARSFWFVNSVIQCDTFRGRTLIHPLSLSDLNTPTRLQNHYILGIAHFCKKCLSFYGHIQNALSATCSGTSISGFSALGKPSGFVYTIPGMKRLQGLLGPQPVKTSRVLLLVGRPELTVESCR